MYIHKNIIYDTLYEFICNYEYDQLWILIKSTHKILIGGIYRHPYNSIKKFNEILNQNLDILYNKYINIKNNEVIIMGDLNINLNENRQANKGR
jgi:hypothetical protein